MADKAYITPSILKWARETARMGLDDAAAKLNVKPERLRSWEDGDDLPTVKQAERLAKMYRRPFSLFFLPDVPRDFLPLQDFRRPGAKPLSTGSVFIIREIQQKQAWMSEMNAENGEEPLGFVGKFSMRDNPAEVAQDIRATLGIDPTRYKASSPIREWIEKAESKGIFVSRTSFIHSHLTLDSDELQGFAIADPMAPFVFINSDDWNAPQLFTLVHELSHIWIAQTGISNEVNLEIEGKDRQHPVERFCNEVAAEALMPAQVIRGIAHAFDSHEAVFGEARRLGVSSYALLVRGLKLGLIALPVYRTLKAAADIEFQAYLAKEEERKAKQKTREGGPNPYLLRLQKNSALFTQIVLDAFRGGRIPPTEASHLLSTRVNNFPKLEAILYS